MRIAKQRGVDLASADLYFGFKLPQIGNWEDVEAVGAMMIETKADVLIVDPAYLCLLDGDAVVHRQASNVMDMGPILRRLTEVGELTDSAVILCHHCRKSPTEGRNRYDPPELEDLAMAGFAEWARQWILVGRRERFEPGTGSHKLWLNVGGSVGMSGCWPVDIEEGVLADDFTGRTWDVSVGSMDEAREERRARFTSKGNRRSGRRPSSSDSRSFTKALRSTPAGASQRHLRDLTGLGVRPLADTLMAMQQKGMARSFEGKRGNQKCDLWTLTDAPPMEGGIGGIGGSGEVV